MNISDFNNKVVILKDKAKQRFVEMMSGKLLNTKIITLSEFKKKYFFDYNNEAIYYVCNKYNVIGEVAKIYLDNLYYIKDNVISNKVYFLNELKEDLLNNKLIYENRLFKSFIKKSKLVLFDLDDIDDFYLNIFNELDSTKYNIKGTFSKKEVYSFSKIEDEVSFVASSICELIKKGIDVNSIKLCNVSNKYYFELKRIFKLFNIPLELPSDESIKGIDIVKKFKELYSNDIKSTLDKTQEYVKNDEDLTYYKRIVNVVNSYSFCDNYESVKDLIFSDINSIEKENKKFTNSVKVIDFLCEIITDNDYLFMINFNEGVIPSNVKDESYLSDIEKKQLNISASYELNEKNKNYLLNKIGYVKNLTISYSLHDDTDELYISSLYNEDNFNLKEYNMNFNNSNSYNKLLLIREKDLNNKYGVISDILTKLNSHYKNELYLSYDNKFKGLDSSKVYEFKNNKLSLSYSSINNYFKCAFRYYINNVLRLDAFEDSFETTIGNIFHKVLSECFVDNYDINTGFENAINSCKYEFNNRDKFFLNKLKKDLELIIETIKKQLSYCSLKKAMYEKNITIKISDDLNIYFTGFVDKILYDEVDGKNIVVIIDYKTGDVPLNLSLVKYGLNMQLPIYIYLVKNMQEIKNVRIGGFYLQKLFDNALNKEDRLKSLMLQGYTNSDKDIAGIVDRSYASSHVIRGLKVTDSGAFNGNSRIISDEEITDLYALVENNIFKARDGIKDALFYINPKKINNKLIGCENCKYKDICYKTDKDAVILDRQVTIDE